MSWQPESDVDEFYRIRVTTNRPLVDEDARHLFGLIGYAFREHLRGEPLGEPEREAEDCWTAWYDITKSASDDWAWRLPEALEAARLYAREGTPPYKTNRAGPIGTRKIEGLGLIKLTFEFE